MMYAGLFKQYIENTHSKYLKSPAKGFQHEKVQPYTKGIPTSSIRSPFGFLIMLTPKSGWLDVHITPPPPRLFTFIKVKGWSPCP